MGIWVLCSFICLAEAELNRITTITMYIFLLYRLLESRMSNMNHDIYEHFTFIWENLFKERTIKHD